MSAPSKKPELNAANSTPIPLVEKRQRLNWQLWAGIAISLVCLYLAFRGIDLPTLAKELRSTQLSWLTLALSTSIITLFAKAARWQMILTPIKKPKYQKVFSAQAIGMLFNLYMPARLGDLARAYLLGEAESISKASVLGTIVIEKLSDLLILLLSIALLLTQFAIPDWLLKSSETTAVVLALSLFALIVLVRRPGFVLKAIERLSLVLPKFWQGWLLRQANHGLASLNLLRSSGQSIRLFLWTVLIWILGFLTNYILFFAARLTLSIWAAVFLLAVLQIGIAVPSSPGRIGVFHYLTMISLAFFRVDNQTALSYSLVLYVVAILPPTLFGAWYLWREKITWRKLKLS